MEEEDGEAEVSPPPCMSYTQAEMGVGSWQVVGGGNPRGFTSGAQEIPEGRGAGKLCPGETEPLRCGWGLQGSDHARPASRTR